MDERTTRWHPPAAYLYCLHLDGPSLAWEYLRRNRDYQEQWHRHCRRRESNGAEAARYWGLRLFEDPALDARDGRPDWIPDPDGLVLVHPDDDPPPGSSPFRFWRLPGRKHLTHDGRRLVLTSQIAGHIQRVAISPLLEDGMAYVYAVRAGGNFRRRWREIEIELAVLDGQVASAAISATRPGRKALLHMRTLQAIDGTQAGASQREVAEMLFGATTVASDWSEDSELRAYVRRLIRRGRRLMTGGYRGLLQIDSDEQGR